MNTMSEQTTSQFCECLGVKLPLVPNAVSAKIEKSIREQKYEAHEHKALMNILSQGDVVMEVGAGIGFLSTACALDQRVRSVCAYEANPTMKDVIETTYRLNAVNVDFKSAAVGRKRSKMPFYVAKDFWASSFYRTQDATITDVDVVPFAEEIAKAKPTVLIIDIEGAEIDILPGADLNSVRSCILELHPNKYGQMGVNRIFEIMRANNLSYDCRYSNRNVVLFTQF